METHPTLGSPEEEYSWRENKKFWEDKGNGYNRYNEFLIDKMSTPFNGGCLLERNTAFKSLSHSDQGLNSNNNSSHIV